MKRVFVALALAVAVAPLPAAAGEPPGAATPQALVARMRAGVTKGELAEMAACTAPDQRRVWALALLRKGELMLQMLGGADDDNGRAAGGAPAPDVAAAAQRVAEFAARQDPLRQTAELRAFHQAILDKHGLTTPAARKALAGVDEPVLIADLTALIDSLVDPAGRVHAGDYPAEVTGYRIQGEKATAKTNGGTLDFVRVDGRWFQVMPPRDMGEGH